MVNNATETAIGALVLAVAAGFLFYASTIVGVRGSADNYELMASFRSAEGVTIGTDVRLAGVKIGTVTGLSLNPSTYRADVRFALDRAVEIPEDSAVSVSSEGLLGGNFVEIIPGGSMDILENGGEIEDTQGSVSLLTLLMKFVAGDAE
jgi:phospholipid/cholesterol/gamma-HCH transport system substrate-binding protein